MPTTERRKCQGSASRSRVVSNTDSVSMENDSAVDTISLPITDAPNGRGCPWSVPEGLAWEGGGEGVGGRGTFISLALTRLGLCCVSKTVTTTCATRQPIDVCCGENLYNRLHGVPTTKCRACETPGTGIVLYNTILVPCAKVRILRTLTPSGYGVLPRPLIQVRLVVQHSIAELETQH